MLFLEENAPLLKKWIVKRLENTSDADADVLADYVLALLRHDGDTATVRRLCEEEIPDFLKEDSSIFVSDVFNALQYKSYLPGAPQPPSRSAFVPNPSPIQFASTAPSHNSVPNAYPALRAPQNGSRKRSYNDVGNDQYKPREGYMAPDVNGRAYKQPRRGGVSAQNSRYDNVPLAWPQNQRSPPLLNAIPSPGFTNMPPMSNSPAGMPPLDPNNPMAAMLAMQAMGFPLPGMPRLPGAPVPQNSRPRRGDFQSNGKKRQRCRDYDEKGFCSRGNSCPYEHGPESIYIPSANEEYDPANSSLMIGIEGNSPSIIFSNPSESQNIRGAASWRGRGRGRGDSTNSSRGGGRHTEFSSNRPNFDKSKTTIVVENIPEESFSEEAVRGFFSEFGEITSVDMRAYKHLAIIKYADFEAAKSAYSSPKVIFDNRFVKVYWFTDNDALPKPPTGKQINSANTGSSTTTPVPARVTDEPQIDIEEFARKQEEVQKVHEEKKRKKAEMESAQKELERRQEELLKNQAEEKRKLMEKIAAKTKPAADSESPIKDSEADAKPTTATDVLKAQLAALEAEAKSLGIDPNAPTDNTWAGRGRGRGADSFRGSWRGRGTYPTRGRGFDRGGFRGRGGAYNGGGNAYKLDNRPRKVALTGLDFTNPEKDESLRQYLLGIGDYESIESTISSTSVTFKDRFTAEKFMYSLTNGEIPSAGKVEMAWVQTPLPPVNPLKTSLTTGNQSSAPTQNENVIDHDENFEMGGVDQDGSEEGEMLQGGGRQGADREVMQELDYDVAEGDW